MKIVNSTELMKNQKHAVIMAPDKQFEVLQTQQGNSLFFSIGTDNIFYCTREIPADTHGWSRFDFSSALSASFSNATIVAKTFDVAQNVATGLIDIALVVTVNGSDNLFVSLGNTNTDTAWAADTIKWTAMPFDDTARTYKTLAIADVFLTEAGASEYIIADILEDPTSTIKSIYRYYIDPSKKNTGHFWNEHDLAADFEAGTITSCVGRKSGQPVDGVYTLGTILNLPQLIYTPVFNAFSPRTAAPTTNFTIPATTTAMAVSVRQSPYTDLFVAAGGSLYYLPYDQQTGTTGAPPTPVLIYSNAVLQGVQKLHVNNSATQTLVWGLNEQGQIFYLSCKPGSEATTTAWSYPVAILTGVEGIATYINGLQNSVIVFAHMQDDTLIQLTQDANTKQWTTRNILLPSADVNDYVENYTFTTHIRLTDDNNVPLYNEPVTISSTAACSVYINNAYHVLYPNTPLQISCDETGTINIQQRTDSLSGIFFKVTDGTTTAVINPMTNVLAKLAPVKTGADLNVNVKDEKGNSTALVNPTYADQQDAIAQYIAQFVAQQSSLPADGTLKPTATTSATAAAAVPITKRTPKKIVGLHTVNGKLVYYDNVEHAKQLGVLLHKPAPTGAAATALGAVAAGDPIELWAADAWNWLKNLVDQVVSMELQIFDEITHFFVTLGNEIYHFAIRLINDIVEGVKFVINKIKVFFDDLVKWLGMIFDWNNYVRTHKVLRSMFVNFTNNTISNIMSTKSSLNQASNELMAEINQWAGIIDGYTFPTDSASSTSASNNSDAGQNTPQSNWGHQQTKNNAPNAGWTAPVSVIGDILNDFFNLVNTEVDIINDAIIQLQDIISQASTTPIGDLVKKIVAVIADVLIASATNIADTLLDVAAQLIGDIVNEVFLAPLNIPVISPLYKLFADEELSLLDAVCLVMAIPLNIIYETAFGSIPFPDNAQTNALINATSLKAFGDACLPPSPTAATQVWDDDTNNFWMKIANILAFVGSVLVTILGALKLFFDTGLPGYIVASLYAICYIPYVAPDIVGLIQNFYDPEHYWFNVMNACIAAVMIIKNCVDIKLVQSADAPTAVAVKTSIAPKTIALKTQNVVGLGMDPNQPAGDGLIPDDISDTEPAVQTGGTPPSGSGWKKPTACWADGSAIIESVLNVAWQVPVYYSYKSTNDGSGTPVQKRNNVVSLVGNTMFNFGGAITVLAAFGPPTVKAATIATQVASNLIYAGCSLELALLPPK